MKVPINKIRSNPFNERKTVNNLESLVESIRERGFWGGLVARAANGIYEIAFGQRRLEAAKKAGIKEIEIGEPQELSDKEMMELTVMENATKEEVPVEERAKHILTYKNKFAKGASNVRLGKVFGIADSTIGELLFVLTLPQASLRAIREGNVGYVKTVEAHKAGVPIKQVIEEKLSREAIQDRARFLKAQSDARKTMNVSQAASKINAKLGVASESLKIAINLWDQLPSAGKKSIKEWCKDIQKLIDKIVKL